MPESQPPPDFMINNARVQIALCDRARQQHRHQQHQTSTTSNFKNSAKLITVMDKYGRQQMKEDEDDEYHDEEDIEQEEDQPRKKRVRVDGSPRGTRGIFIGHQADAAEIEVYARPITALGDQIRCTAHGKHGTFKIGMDNVNLIDEILDGQPQGFWSEKRLREQLKKYLRSKSGDLASNSTQTSNASHTRNKAHAGNPSRTSIFTQANTSTGASILNTNSKTDQPTTSIENKLAVISRAAHDVQGDFDTMKATITTQENTIQDLQQTIRDLSNQVSTGTIQPPTPGPPQGQTQTSTGKYVIGDKVYAQMPAGSQDEGVYVEKEGRYKNGFLEKNVLSEYKRYVGAGWSGESVKIKDIEFHKMINGDLLQKQEKLVEIEGKTYVRRKLHVAYSSDEE